MVFGYIHYMRSKIGRYTKKIGIGGNAGLYFIFAATFTLKIIISFFILIMTTGIV